MSNKARDDFLQKRNDALLQNSSKSSDPFANLGNPFGNPTTSTNNTTTTATTTTTTTPITTTTNMTQSRREDLLNLARQERDEFLDDAVIQTSPEIEPIRSIGNQNQNKNKTNNTNNTNKTTAAAAAPPSYTASTTATSSTTNSSNTNTNANTKSSSSIPASTNDDETRASFLQTAQRLFSFLNRFSGDDVGPNGELKMPDFQPFKPTSKINTTSTNNSNNTNTNNNNNNTSKTTQPPFKKQFNYKAFKEKIKNPHAGEAFKRIKRFVIDFGKQSGRSSQPKSRAESGRTMRTFLDEVERLMSVNELWCHDDPDEWDNTCEGLEKFVTSKLYEHIFCPREEDKQRDVELENRIASLSFVSYQHLDINGPEIKDEFLLTWQLAMDEIGKMNDYKAPRDKMVCLLNACKVIVRLLTEASEDVGATPPGADQFLPALIYVVLKSNPPNLFSNLDYIDRFRNPTKMISEPGYWYTNLYSAVTFLENVEHGSLTITEEEFAAGMLDAKAQMKEAKEMARTSMTEEEDGNNGNNGNERNGTKQLEAELEDVFSSIGNSSNGGNGGNGGQAETKSRQSSRNIQSKGTTKQQQSLLRAKRWVASSQPPLQPPLQGFTEVQKKLGTDCSLVEWKALRYRFNARNLNEIRVTEIGSLLNEYKYLTSTTEKLLKEREMMIARIRELESGKK